MTVGASDAVVQLREKSLGRNQVPVARQRIVFAGKELIDANTLSSSNIGDGAGVMLVVRPAPSAASSVTSSDVVEATQAPKPVEVSLPPPAAPRFPPEVDKCWNAAYVSDWNTTLTYLDSNVSLEQLEQRCNKSLVPFFAERQMIDALIYLEAKRGKLSSDDLYHGLCAAVTTGSTSIIDFFVSRGATADLCQQNDLVQPLKLAVRYPRPTL
eukprot:TRINITY_DN3432_c0_g2_i1.p1 TRINITY_DN3432_c0_g2~~TRINITY_DN3432_c0_g2_i1.p1  ORF type:complete len:226 (+),score=25.89 TRINITY_DN3432_c0_g2_i1:44-679(+)